MKAYSFVYRLNSENGHHPNKQRKYQTKYTDKPGVKYFFGKAGDANTYHRNQCRKNHGPQPAQREKICAVVFQKDSYTLRQYTEIVNGKHYNHGDYRQ